MQLLGHDDPNVRYEALLAVQKLMVHNWYDISSSLVQCPDFNSFFLLVCREYLGKQLEKDSEKTSQSGSTISGKA